MGYLRIVFSRNVLDISAGQSEYEVPQYDTTEEIHMERIVVQQHFPKVSIQKLKRVATYARVSSGKDAMLHSLSAQVSYYAT